MQPRTRSVGSNISNSCRWFPEIVAVANLAIFLYEVVNFNTTLWLKRTKNSLALKVNCFKSENSALSELIVRPLKENEVYVLSVSPCSEGKLKFPLILDYSCQRLNYWIQVLNLSGTIMQPSLCEPH